MFAHACLSRVHRTGANLLPDDTTHRYACPNAPSYTNSRKRPFWPHPFPAHDGDAEYTYSPAHAQDVWERHSSAVAQDHTRAFQVLCSWLSSQFFCCKAT